MPRNYGRFTTSIWRDPDFTALEPGQQWAYFMLCTQAEVSAAGVLPLRMRRWAKNAAGVTTDTLRGELDVLEQAGHIITDDESEELLIRKFMKWDSGFRNEKRAPVVRDAIWAIDSPQIRDNAVDELRRLMASDGISSRAREVLTPVVSDAISGSDRDGVTLGDQEPEPLTPIPEREPVAGDPLSPFCPEHQPDGTDKPCGACGTRRAAAEDRARRGGQQLEQATARRLELVAGCDRCNPQGFVEGPDGGLIGKCSHSLPVAAAVSGVGVRDA